MVKPKNTKSSKNLEKKPVRNQAKKSSNETSPKKTVKRRLLSSYKREELEELAMKRDKQFTKEDAAQVTKATLAKVAGLNIKAPKFNPKKIKNSYFYVPRTVLLRICKQISSEYRYGHKFSKQYIDELNEFLLNQLQSILIDAKEITLSSKRERTTGNDVILASKIRRDFWSNQNHEMIIPTARGVDNYGKSGAKRHFLTISKANLMKGIKPLGLRRLAKYSGIDKLSGCTFLEDPKGMPTFYSVVSNLYYNIVKYVVDSTTILLIYKNRKIHSTNELKYALRRVNHTIY